jgi:hypothetical protein
MLNFKDHKTVYDCGAAFGCRIIVASYWPAKWKRQNPPGVWSWRIERNGEIWFAGESRFSSDEAREHAWWSYRHLTDQLTGRIPKHAP